MSSQTLRRAVLRILSQHTSHDSSRNDHMRLNDAGWHLVSDRRRHAAHDNPHNPLAWSIGGGDAVATSAHVNDVRHRTRCTR
jgi:hypothetical protein